MAIVPSGVSVPAQSKELDNNVVTTSYGTVYRQVVNLADPETPTNYQRVGSNGAYVDVRNVVSLPLPTGASTAALQTSGNASLTSIDTKLPSLDSGYVPVTIKNSSIEISNDAGNPVPVSGTFWQATQPVSGTFWQATQPVSGTFWQATQPVSGTFWQTTQPVSGTFWQATQPVSAVSLPLPTGAATESTLSALSAKFSALGQATMAASVPVVLASNHSDIVTKKSASSYAHLNSTGTTTIKSGAGILRRVVINTRGGVLNTFTIYDNTSGSGTVIAVIDTVNGVSGQFEYGVSFSTGLTVVNATGTSADITVIYE